jgi:hypothetical protein
VEMSVKYHSNPHREDQSIVENVIKNGDLQEETEYIRKKPPISLKSDE